MKSRRNRFGFTLAEVLIVTAMIAVLVGISIPIFTAQKEKAKVAAVRANIRAAKSAAYYAYLDNGLKGSGDAHGYYIYNVKDGTVTLNASGSNYKNYSGTSFDSANKPSSLEYTYIFVYIKVTSMKDEATAADIQSCPYYDNDQQKIVYALDKPYQTGN
jgi:prepilin-type N-terminal cleavage/methylation domain-containing protein